MARKCDLFLHVKGETVVQKNDRNPSSFRDPSGYIFEQDGQLYRHIDKSYAVHFNRLVDYGLLRHLFDNQLLVPHEVVSIPDPKEKSYATLKPTRLPLITYPYEWSFGQLKDAALLTLEVLKQSLNYGMVLKDASAFNIQFIGYKPIFIDTLSFAIYEEGQPWYGYRQFCEHFLAPLCLSSFIGVELLKLNRLGVDGVPLKMTSTFLPLTSWFKPVPFLHIHLHAKSIEHYSNNAKVKAPRSESAKVSKRSLLAMIDHLERFLVDLKLKKTDKTQWDNYDKETHYSDAGRLSKGNILKEFVAKVSPLSLWDLGANDGYFSRLIGNDNLLVLSLDSDALAVEKNYQNVKGTKNKNVYPLLFDVVNPSPSIGWGNEERAMLSKRTKPDLIVALALIHHLVITNNIPFEKIANYLCNLAEWLIIEFIPIDDEKICLLPNTAGKKSYSRQSFEFSFFNVYELIEEQKIQNSERSILLFRRK